MEFTGIKIIFIFLFIFFFFLLKSMGYWYSLEPPRRGGSYKYHILCFEQEYEKYQNFLSENFPFLIVKFSIYLNRHVFVVSCPGIAKITDHIIPITLRERKSKQTVTDNTQATAKRNRFLV